MYSPIAQPVLEHRFKLAFWEESRATKTAVQTAKRSLLRVEDDFARFTRTPAHEEDRKKYADLYAEAASLVEKKEGKLRHRLRRKLRNETDEQVILRHDKAVALKFYPNLVKQLVLELDAISACQEAVEGRQQRLTCNKKILDGRELVLTQVRACRIHIDCYIGNKTELYKEWMSLEKEVMDAMKGKNLCAHCRKMEKERKKKEAESSASCEGPVGENSAAVDPVANSSVTAPPTEAEVLKRLKATRVLLMKDLDIFNRFIAIIKSEEQVRAAHAKWLLGVDLRRIFNSERMKAGKEPMK
ncbi:predicted protein [Verticillium alfalfae VaMs.102]|uniref:Predicted protein n=1 Tax=Verticillium alfalfae (strain VaMs.102 / ATCC MYA-4576 / FGSC 10136) TaxID=526221 RepID=C9SSH4_VERA1|nr:predicted protein [Verticillium alfalfae VaMs.102]EEY21739.1 predicted protein [Verticillium alfalfae VaMs.102]